MTTDPAAKEIVYIPFKSTSGYSESDQSVQVRMAFLQKRENVYTEMFLPVMCRDYLNDILHQEYFQIKPESVCGFSYDGRTSRIDRDQIRLSLQCASLDHFATLGKNLFEILHPIEAANDFELSSVKQPNSKVLIIEGDKRWLTSTFLLSSYTLLIRLAGLPYTNPQNWATEITTNQIVTLDRQFLGHKFKNKGWLDFIAHLGKFASIAASQSGDDASPSGYSRDCPLHSVHFGSGILSTVTGKNKYLFKLLEQAAAA